MLLKENDIDTMNTIKYYCQTILPGFKIWGYKLYDKFIQVRYSFDVKDLEVKTYYYTIEYTKFNLWVKTELRQKKLKTLMKKWAEK